MKNAKNVRFSIAKIIVAVAILLTATPAAAESPKSQSPQTSRSLQTTSKGTVSFELTQKSGQFQKWQPGLSDRELAIQRWFSWLTFQADRRETPWPEWFTDDNQLGMTSLRYQLAFGGYGCAAMASQTPAYRELGQKQLDDVIQRLIDVRCWHYVTHYWKYGDDPPDPCQQENVMYSGHLAQLICMFESLTGDMRYSTVGWDFTWRDGRKTHYTLGRLLDRLHALSKASQSGGICCEPNLVFIVCNSHSSLSFVMSDLIHGTHYSDAADRWFAWMSKHGRSPMAESPEYLRCVFHKATKIWAPLSDFGGDGWALGWGYVWVPQTKFADDGWQYMRLHAQWVSPKPGETYVKGNALVGCCACGLLPIRNSFLPLVAVEAEGAKSRTAQKLLAWFESEFGRSIDTDGDGVKDAYYYQTDRQMRVAATGNIAAALATDRLSLRNFFRTWRPSRFHEPTLAHVDYPNVYVRTAEFIAPALRFTILKGKPGFKGKTTLVCENISGSFTLLRDGKPYVDFEKADRRVAISTDVDREHVFELTLGR
jgi:hypothetical protein